MIPDHRRLPIALLLLRLAVFAVMLVWTIEKFVDPGHASTIFAYFYGIEGVGTGAVYVLGALELVLLAAFVVGLRKRISYGLVMVIHGATTFASLPAYFAPFENILFFAAWPMLAACVALYLLRGDDTLATVERRG